MPLQHDTQPRSAPLEARTDAEGSQKKPDARLLTGHVFILSEFVENKKSPSGDFVVLFQNIHRTSDVDIVFGKVINHSRHIKMRFVINYAFWPISG